MGQIEKKVTFNNNPLACISLITAVSVINSYLTKVFQCGNGVYINSIYVAILKVTDQLQKKLPNPHSIYIHIDTRATQI